MKSPLSVVSVLTEMTQTDNLLLIAEDKPAEYEEYYLMVVAIREDEPIAQELIGTFSTKGELEQAYNLIERYVAITGSFPSLN